MNYKLVSILTAFLLIAACSTEKMPGGGGLPATLKDVPSVRLNFRYEPDVPPPETTQKTGAEERSVAVQADFDQNRPQEIVDRTVTSPDGNRVAVVYHQATDLPSEFRLDMYTADGKVLRKVTSDLMAVHFPDTIRWSPDSTSLAFLAMLRGASAELTPDDPNKVELVPVATPTPTPAIDTNANVDVNAATPEEANTNVEANPAVPTEPTPEAPTGLFGRLL